MFELYTERARRVVIMALWLARRRGASYIEPEDLLHASIREDWGSSLPSIWKCFLVLRPHRKSRRWPPFLHRRNSEEFASSIARGTRPSDSGHAEQKARASAARRYAGFAVFEGALALAAKIAQRKDSKIVEPLHLLAAIVEDRESRLAQLLRDNGVTRQRVAQAFGAGAASG